MGDDFTVSTPELARSALINLDNLAKFTPALERHPMFRIVREQLEATCERLESEETQAPA